ncbi:uncharacterized protein LOC117180340 [Belonocnema kinseyi]|uniref:uncharacterized protein LOC117180340 n=1 Tax=Belonocnema kinseyi TaxID=2817044 RepID=UPI00143D08D3|nr:uncharacterized protein LOC117180340 [Belonocnema kinseyi]
MSKIVIVLCVTILVANLVLAKSQDYEEVLAQEVQELLDYQRNVLTSKMFLNNFADLEDDSDDEKDKKCRRPLERCCDRQKCCSKLRCSKFLARCLPKFGTPKPTEDSLNV